MTSTGLTAGCDVSASADMPEALHHRCNCKQNISVFPLLAKCHESTTYKLHKRINYAYFVGCVKAKEESQAYEKRFKSTQLRLSVYVTCPPVFIAISLTESYLSPLACYFAPFVPRVSAPSPNCSTCRNSRYVIDVGTFVSSFRSWMVGDHFEC